eukprot:TRINITY_DN7162_c0_g1_i7.p1 TRINITY_DN7162_c0_g1~~TRINITY_DN7162_c0_g1_i7.p1  ORF type:complete len:549 (-),score=131.48 TRINITY_DN7162_c0_g1_i7:729-2342(-)
MKRTNQSTPYQRPLQNSRNSSSTPSAATLRRLSGASNSTGNSRLFGGGGLTPYSRLMLGGTNSGHSTPQRRPSSGQSTASSSGNSGNGGTDDQTATKVPPTDAMSSTARLILETLEKMSTPLKDSDKMPTLSVDRKRVAEELNNSLGLTPGNMGSARKRPRLGNGPLGSGGTNSPLAGPPFRKLYSPLSANRSRPPRVNHITPMATLNNSASNSRPSTPGGGLDTIIPPPAPPNIPPSITAFSTPLSTTAAAGASEAMGGGKVRNRVTKRSGDRFDEEEAPPLPSFLTNNIPTLKVNTPLTGFSFGGSTNKKSGEEEEETSKNSAQDHKDDVETQGNKKESNNNITINFKDSSAEKSSVPMFGLNQPLVAAKSTPTTAFNSSATPLTTTTTNNSTSGQLQQKQGDNNAVGVGGVNFNFSSPVNTLPKRRKSGASDNFSDSNSNSSGFGVGSGAGGLPTANKTVFDVLGIKKKEEESSKDSSEDSKSKPLVNGSIHKDFIFQAPEKLSVQQTQDSTTTKCSKSFTFSTPQIVVVTTSN